MTNTTTATTTPARFGFLPSQEVARAPYTHPRAGQGWGIAIIRQGDRFSVVRYGWVDGVGSRFVRLSAWPTEAAARAAANVLWRTDMSAFDQH